MLVGEGHHQVAADSGLDVLRGEVGLGGAGGVTWQRLLGRLSRGRPKAARASLVLGHRCRDRELDQLGT